MFTIIMLYWIFDLDNTLYNISGQFSYSKLKKDINLSNKLSLLPEKLIIFTNANENHTYECLKKIGIKDNFNSIIHRDINGYLKPNINSFIKTYLLLNLNYHDKCIFFEDTLSNLIQAKNFGWITVYINPVAINHPLVDYSFTDIHIALNYFIDILY